MSLRVPSQTGLPVARQVTRAQLVEVLAAALGQDKAEKLIRGELEARGIVAEALPLDAALDLLERLAAQPGLVGITARFAKSRLLLGGA